MKNMRSLTIFSVWIEHNLLKPWYTTLIKGLTFTFSKKSYKYGIRLGERGSYCVVGGWKPQFTKDVDTSSTLSKNTYHSYT